MNELSHQVTRIRLTLNRFIYAIPSADRERTLLVATP